MNENVWRENCVCSFAWRKPSFRVERAKTFWHPPILFKRRRRPRKSKERRKRGHLFHAWNKDPRPAAVARTRYAHLHSGLKVWDTCMERGAFNSGAWVIAVKSSQLHAWIEGIDKFSKYAPRFIDIPPSHCQPCLKGSFFRSCETTCLDVSFLRESWILYGFKLRSRQKQKSTEVMLAAHFRQKFSVV